MPNQNETNQSSTEPEKENSKTIPKTNTKKIKQSKRKPVVLRPIPKQTILERQRRNLSHVELEAYGKKVK